MNSFGILNQLEKTGKMWGFLSDFEPSPTKKKHGIRKMGRNRTEITKKQKITNISKEKELDEMLGRP